MCKKERIMISLELRRSIVRDISHRHLHLEMISIQRIYLECSSKVVGVEGDKI
jgi:hypothetical protein